MALARTGSPNTPPKVGGLDRHPDAPAVLARDLKLDQEGQGLQDHLATRRHVDQVVELAGNAGQVQPGQPAGEPRALAAETIDHDKVKPRSQVTAMRSVSGRSAEGRLTLSIHQAARSWSAASGDRASEAQRPGTWSTSFRASTSP
jgi:hypothetical protein